jgi:hypothetical protein
MAVNQKEQMQDLKVQQEDWMVKKWRPMMGWTYMATCIFDFILGPILFNLLQYWNPGQAVGMWTPLTLQGGGMYHIAMGAILGISAWSRGQEKMTGSNSPLVSQAPVMTNAPQQSYQQPSYQQEQSYAEPTPRFQEDYSAPQESSVNVTINSSDINGRPKRKKPNF